MDELLNRLKEIDLWERIIGRYSGLLTKLYSDKVIEKEYYKSELEFVQKCLVQVKGLDCEDIAIISQQIKELYE